MLNAERQKKHIYLPLVRISQGKLCYAVITKIQKNKKKNLSALKKLLFLLQ